MQLNSRTVSLSHYDAIDTDGGEYHLTLDEYTKLKTLIENGGKIDAMLKPNTYGVYAFGPIAPLWNGETEDDESYNDQTLMRKLTLPSRSKPMRITMANPNTFLVLLANSETYGYGVAINKYILNSPTKPITNADLATPVKFELGDWADVGYPEYFTSSAPNSNYPPYVLTDTSKHLGAPKADNVSVIELKWTTGGDGFEGNYSGNLLSYTSPSGALMKRMFIRSSAGVLWAEDGLYYVKFFTAKATVTSVPFSFGTIKNVWPLVDCYLAVQNTDGVVYFGGIAADAASSFAPLGEWDVKKITRNTHNRREEFFMLTNSGEVYWMGAEYTKQGLPESYNTFTRILPNYRFDDIEGNAVYSFMGIGEKIQS